MATAISPVLNRALRRGSVATTTVPQTGHVMRAQTSAAHEAEDTSELDRVFAGLSAQSLTQQADGQTQLDSIAPVDQSLKVLDRVAIESPAEDRSDEARPRRRLSVDAGATAHVAASDKALPDDVLARQSSKPALAPERPAREVSSALPVETATARSRRFMIDGGDSVQAGSTPMTQAPDSTAVQPSRSWSNLTHANDRVDVVNARKSMSAAKVIAPLVAAVSFHPGSAAASLDRSTGLRQLLVSVHQNAVQTAEGISEALQEDVPSWMVTQLMQSYAHIIARRWEKSGNADPNVLGQAMVKLLANHSQEVAALVRGASEDAYIEVSGPDVARHRVAVSVTSAAWTLYDWVTHERLCVDSSGDMPNEFYTYGLEPFEIVNRLLVRCVDECRALVIQNDSADLRTAHMQSSIHRMSQLVGSEYVTQTRQVMNWIGEDGITEEEFAARLASASAELDTRILPHVFEWARTNFIRIEQGAVQAIGDLDRKRANERDARQQTH